MQPRVVFNSVGLVLLLAGPIAGRADEPDHASADVQCARTAHVTPPQADLPTPVQRQALADCDAEALYYGIGRTADPAQARLCAFVQQSKEPPSQPVGFFGSHMLMVIYANGIGAARNIPYAIHLACTTSEAPAEQDGRVAHLMGHREPWYKDRFGYCDDATSGLTGGYCAAHDQRLKQQDRTRVLASYAKSLPPAAEPAFQALTPAQDAWGKARGSNEVDLMGTARVAMAIDEQDLQARDFLSMLDRLQSGHPPRPGPADLARAQARMQSVLDRIMREPGYLNDGTVAPDGVAEAQKSWEAYRMAWAVFAAQAYPAWGAAAANAWVTMKRADMLAHLH